MTQTDATNGKRLVDHILTQLTTLNAQVATLREDVATLRTLIEQIGRSEDAFQRSCTTTRHECREQVDEELTQLAKLVEELDGRQNTLVSWLKGITIAYGILTAIFIILTIVGDAILPR